MLRVYQSSNAAQAKDYFTQELTQGDYYTGGQEIAGVWGGKAAAQLGLSGTVERQEFNLLVDNINPETGERLTAHNKPNRRPGYDLTFNAPKALSVLYEYSQDERLLDAFRQAVHTTMESIQEGMHARVRANGKNEDRKTGNLAYAEFVHFTARPVEGMAPDPHLHAHCFVMNATHDEVEDKWKAGQFGEIKRNAPYYEAMFHSHLAKSLSDMGLNIERDGKFWTIEGIDKETLNKFSNRTEQIEEYAESNNITTAKGKDALGQKLRGRKVGGLTKELLHENWWDRLEEQEKETLDGLLESGGEGEIEREVLTASDCLEYSILHHFERQSVVPLTRIQETALRYGVGHIDPMELEKAISEHSELIVQNRGGLEMATTSNVLLEEKVITKFTKNTYASLDKLNTDYQIGKVKNHITGDEFELAKEQKQVVSGLLDSRNRIMAVEGKAGTGKTTALATLIDGIEQGGGSAVCLAPTADAAYDTLRKDGEAYNCGAMQNAHTIARYFVDENLWEKSRGAVLLVDEAGLLSVDDMHTLFGFAHAHDNRVVLIGDTSQHNSVKRGDAYRILKEEAGLKPLLLDDIRRQKGEYREAVNSISKGDILEGYDRLDALRAVCEETDDEKRYRTLAEEYTAIVEKGESVLTVSPTHREGEKVTRAIREKLKEDGHIAQTDKSVTRFKNLQLTEAERSDINNYREGHMIRFQQNSKGEYESIKKGEQFTVSRTEKNNVWVKDKGGREQILDLSVSKRFNVYERNDIQLAGGDMIRITEGGKSKDGRRVNNGAIYEVSGINKQGDIVLKSGRVLDHEKGNFAYGYVATSHASQGKTVDHVLIAQSCGHSGATSSEQFYVSVSRGKKSARIFTDDKELLREQILNSHQRISATELTRHSHNIEIHNQTAALRHYAKYSMPHLEGTPHDYLREFRDSVTPANDRVQEPDRQRGMSI